jgi:hypothetical protein
VFVHSQYDKETPKNLMDGGSSQYSSLVMIGFVPASVPLSSIFWGFVKVETIVRLCHKISSFTSPIWVNKVNSQHRASERRGTQNAIIIMDWECLKWWVNEVGDVKWIFRELVFSQLAMIEVIDKQTNSTGQSIWTTWKAARRTSKAG